MNTFGGLRRGEVKLLVCVVVTTGIVLIGCAAAFAIGSYSRLRSNDVYQAEARAAYEKAYAAAAQDVALGQAVTLTGDGAFNLCLYEGTKTFTVVRYATYQSLQEAAVTENLGNVISPTASSDLLGLSDGDDSAEPLLLILELDISNVDASENGSDTFLIDSEVRPNAPHEIALFDNHQNMPGPKQVTRYTLPAGETDRFLVGYWIRSDTDLDHLTVGIGYDGLWNGAPITVHLAPSMAIQP